jgi:hypothetical protein
MSKYFKAGAKVFEYLKPKPKVNKTELDKAKSKLDILKHKTKMSRAKLNQTLFEIKNKQDLTFKTNTEKTLSNTKRKKKADARIIEKRNEESKKMFKKVESKKDGGRMGLKFGGGADKQLSSKQMKIASLAGNKKKIDGPDFKKLRAMKSPISKSVKKA